MFLDISRDIGLGSVLMLIHFSLFFLALAIWSSRGKGTYLTSKSFGIQAAICFPVSVLCFFMFANFQGVVTYVALTYVSVGVFPIVTMTIYFLTGRLLGKYIYQDRREN